MRQRLVYLVRPALVLLCAVFIGAGSPITASAGAASHTEAAPLRYVALGDSYSSAAGVLPVDPTAPLRCLRSLRNYPHVIAGAIGASLRDVTCSGADTSDFYTAQYDDAPAQLGALSSSTRLVTMTIGGNDSSVFSGLLQGCVKAGLSTLGRGNPCQQQYGTSFEQTVKQKTYPALVKALKAVHAKARYARVAILGYPNITPETGSCYPQLPVASGDVAYLHHVQEVLNDAVRRAAAATRSAYVDFSKVSVGHDACRAIGTRWIEPVVGTTNPVIVHPNALGEQQMAKRTMAVLHLV